ncbi:hypothetical protein B9G55_02540 [Saccharibacillus sp. O16]|nr:hypothetical protein B9G55_02540 [Saccharibacillus sp. O16]
MFEYYTDDCFSAGNPIDGIMRLYETYLMLLGKTNKAEYYALALGEFVHRWHEAQLERCSQLLARVKNE